MPPATLSRARQGRSLFDEFPERSGETVDQYVQRWLAHRRSIGAMTPLDSGAAAVGLVSR